MNPNIQEYMNWFYIVLTVLVVYGVIWTNKK